MNIKFPPLPTANEMQEWDNDSINLGIPEFTLMENAAREALYVLQKIKGPLQKQYVLLFMGGGNNGGDAAALARHLNDLGAHPLILHNKSLKNYGKTSTEHIKLSKALGIPFIKLTKNADIKKLIPSEWHKPHIIIDGLLGTGFSPPLRANMEQAINIINKMSKNSFVLALDIPSGCSANSGLAHGLAVKAQATVCFAAAKPGLVMPHAKAYTGHLYVRNIGIPQCIVQKHEPSFKLIEAKGMVDFLPPITKNSHKNTWGHVLVIGGSKGLSGAAHLTARAALRSGVGLVTVAAPSALCHEIKADTPDIMTLNLENENHDNYTWPKQLPQKLLDKIPNFKAIALGPGLSTSPDAINFMQKILECHARPRAIIDADALNILAKHQNLLKLIQDDDILTPHPGEAARLLNISTKDVQNDRINCIQKLTALAPCVWLLKGAASLLAQGTKPIHILPHDIPSLAVAGSGDVLSGCCAAMAAQLPNLNSLQVAAISMTIHANTGFMAQEIFPKRGNMASDLVELLPAALANLASFPKGYNDDF